MHYSCSVRQNGDGKHKLILRMSRLMQGDESGWSCFIQGKKDNESCFVRAYE